MAKEIETTLAVLALDPVSLMEEIAALGSLGRYRLRTGGSQSLKDTYYDTPSRLLSGRGIAFRTRELGNDVLFCIKQDEQVDDTGMAIRDEIELPWSLQCFDQASRILHNANVDINEIPFRTDSPGECLACLGLVPVQERLTTRLVIDAVLPDGPHQGIAAEMVLDRVCYTLCGLSVFHHEIEIEARLPDTHDPVTELAGLLRKRFRDDLMPWCHNKLVTGFALEKLAAEGRLTEHPGIHAFLSRIDYDAIESVLKDFQRTATSS